jgi:lysophospholipase L1-like esterase
VNPKEERTNQRKRLVKPQEVFLALLLLNAMLGLVIIIFPNGKIPLWKDFSLKVTPFERLFHADTSRYVDVGKVLEGLEPIDTNLENIPGTASYKLNRERFVVPENRQIQYPDSSKKAMLSFFQHLMQTEISGKPLHIIHWGDSQLEGDRISDYLRNKLQLIFGGYGPGVVLPLDVSNSRVSIWQSESIDWMKMAIYGNKEKHPEGFYGIGASTYKYSGVFKRKIGEDTLIERVYLMPETHDSSGIHDDSLQIDYNATMVTIDSNKFYNDTVITPRYEVKQNSQSWLKFKCATNSFPRVRHFNKVLLLYGNTEQFRVSVQIDDTVFTDTVLPVGKFGVKIWKAPIVSKGVSFSFRGVSPDIYGVSLESDSGIWVDNFPMRGSSALGFEEMNPELLALQMKVLNAPLIIMQYGINVVPNPQKSYDYYERMFLSQLQAIKKALPEVSILVIGPSDMSTRINGEYASYPNIPLIRNAMRNAAFKTGTAFWDLYEAMGGQNSMLSWVQEKPSLAAKDFTHFNPQGARYVGEMIYEALMKDYFEYKKMRRRLNP